jgi:hypothetical protein
MRAITDLETLYQWARERCKDKHIPIWIGEDTESKDIMLIVGKEYAVIPSWRWLHDAQYLFEETIKVAEEYYRCHLN